MIKILLVSLDFGLFDYLIFSSAYYGKVTNYLNNFQCAFLQAKKN